MIPEAGFSLAVFFDIFVPLADALALAYERGVIHRDIKPANIMVTREDTPKILDFGIARLHRPKYDQADERSSDESLTRIGTIIGPPAYMSPQQPQGGKKWPIIDPILKRTPGRFLLQWPAPVRIQQP